MSAIKVWGLMLLQSSQKEAIKKHCFGDCGKISMAGVIDDELTGGLAVCCEPVCPYLDKEMDTIYGTTNSFGEPHEIYLRTVKM